MSDLTSKQEKFAQEVASGKSQAEAYRVAYDTDDMKDTTICKRASELMLNGEITGRIEKIRQPIVEKAQLTLDRHLVNLLNLRDGAINDGKWGAAVAAEIARGKAAGIYENKGDSDTDKEITVQIVEFKRPDVLPVTT